MLPPIHGPAWGYRHRARFSVRLVEKKGGVLVGFHEKRSSFVADMRECHVVPARVSDLLLPLRELVGSLSIARRLPQIELAIGEGATPRDLVIALVLRVLEPLQPADAALVAAFATRHDVVFWLQPKGPDTIVPFDPTSPAELSYALPEFGVRIHFLPTDFTQVNAGDQSGPGRSCAAAARRAAGRSGRGPVLRTRQLLAVDRPTGPRGGRDRRKRRDDPARRRQRGAQRTRVVHVVPGGEPVRGRRAISSRSSGVSIAC